MIACSNIPNLARYVACEIIRLEVVEDSKSEGSVSVLGRASRAILLTKTSSTAKGRVLGHFGSTVKWRKSSPRIFRDKILLIKLGIFLYMGIHKCEGNAHPYSAWVKQITSSQTQTTVILVVVTMDDTVADRWLVC